MPNVELLPVPRRDDTILSYLNTNFRRVADALGLAPTKAEMQTAIDAAAPTGDSGWTNVTGFQNGWTSYGGGYPPQYRKLANGEVIFRGLMIPGTMSAVAFTTPVGYRHTGPAEQYHVVTGHMSGYNSFTLYHYANGNVVPAHNGGRTGTPSWISLASFRFLAEG